MNHFGGFLAKNNPPLFKILSLGMARQAFFFTLSGFLLFYVFSSDSLDIPANRLRWYKRRFVRVAPVYYVALILALANFALLKRSQLSSLDFIVGSVLRFVGLHSLFPKYVYEPQVLLASWSLSVEVIFYFLFPFIAQFAKGWDRKRLIVLLLAGLLYSSSIIPVTRALTEDKYGSTIWYANGLMYVGCFASGCAIARLLSVDSKPKRWLAWATIIVGALLFFVDFVQLSSVWLPGLLLPVFGAVLLLYGCGQLSRLPQPPKTPAFLDLLGNSAYCLFLFHGPIGSVCNSVLLRIGWQPISESSVSLITYSVISVISSVCLYKYLELPFRARFAVKTE